MISYVYERGWRQGFSWAGFPGGHQLLICYIWLLQDLLLIPCAWLCFDNTEDSLLKTCMQISASPSHVPSISHHLSLHMTTSHEC